MSNLSEIFNTVWESSPDWVKVVLGITSAGVYLYKGYLKPRIYKNAIKGGITINEAKIAASKSAESAVDIEREKTELFNKQQEYLREEIKTFRYGLRDKFEEILSKRMPNIKCPATGEECPKKDFIYSSSVNTCIGLLLTVSVRIYRRLEMEIKSESFYDKDGSELKKYAYHLADGFSEMGKDTVRDFYPPDSVIPLNEGLKYFDEYILDEMKCFIHSLVKELKSMHNNTMNNISKIEIKTNNETSEIYGE